MSLALVSKALAAKHAMPEEVVQELVLDALRCIEQQSIDAGRCAIRGFGVFKVREFAPRPGRNIRTGEAVVVPARRRLVFQHATDRARTLMQDTEQ